ncbi:MAG: hypothetical protein WCT18_04460 [Patescibacteria group bacterium]
MQKGNKILTIIFLVLAIFILASGIFVKFFLFSDIELPYVSEFTVNDPYNPDTSLEFLEKMSSTFEKKSVFSNDFWEVEQINGNKENPFINKK